MLFLWDVLFGTAHITRGYPRSYGVENLAPASLGQQLLWPIFPERKAAEPAPREPAQATGGAAA